MTGSAQSQKIVSKPFLLDSDKTIPLYRNLSNIVRCDGLRQGASESAGTSLTSRCIGAAVTLCDNAGCPLVEVVTRPGRGGVPPDYSTECNIDSRLPVVPVCRTSPTI